MVAPLEVRSPEEKNRLGAVMEFIQQNSQDLLNRDVLGRIPSGIVVPDFHLKDGLGRLYFSASQRETRMEPGLDATTVFRTYVTQLSETVSTRGIADIPLTSFYWQLPDKPLYAQQSNMMAMRNRNEVSELLN